MRSNSSATFDFLSTFLEKLQSLDHPVSATLPCKTMSQQAYDSLMPFPELQVDAPPIPPSGRGPPRVLLAELPERPTCKQHPGRKLRDEEITKGYVRCLECRYQESALAAAMNPLRKSKMSDKCEEKLKTSLLSTLTAKVRSVFFRPSPEC